jgi:hypothetical protein
LVVLRESTTNVIMMRALDVGISFALSLAIAVSWIADKVEMRVSGPYCGTVLIGSWRLVHPMDSARMHVMNSDFMGYSLLIVTTAGAVVHRTANAAVVIPVVVAAVNTNVLPSTDSSHATVD